MSELKELFPEIVCRSRKIFICEECFNKFQKYLRAQGKLNSAKAEFEHEKNAFVSLHSTHTLRQKRTLGTPQRPRNPPKQFVCDQRSPSKIPVLILPQHGPGKENVPHPETKLAAFRQSFQKDGHSSPSKIPVPSQTKITEKKQVYIFYKSIVYTSNS